MIINIPNGITYNINNLVLDYNGTIAESGELLESASKYFHKISKILDIYVVTGDTFFNARNQLKNHPVKVIITDPNNGVNSKLDFIKTLNGSIAIGNGSIDYKMLEYADIGFAILGPEGLSKKAFDHADILVRSIDDAFEMILNTKKLIATLRE